LAFTKLQKVEILNQYKEHLDQSQAVFLMSFSNMSVKRVQDLRAKVREVGGEAHVVKNTLLQIALKEQGIELDEVLEGTTLAGFAYNDAPGLAKTFRDAVKEDKEIFALKYGFLEGKLLSEHEIKALAELPPLPVMRAQLLGTLQAPASQLVRTLAEPARQVAAVLKAYSEIESVPAAG
jgi:large subunit ribosomal protein L10